MPCFCRDEEKSLGASILFQSFMTWLIDNENAEIIQPILLMVAYWHTFSFVFIKGNSEKQEISLGIFGFYGAVKVWHYLNSTNSAFFKKWQQQQQFSLY